VFLVFFDILLGFGAIIGIPVGVVATGIGAVTSLLTRQKDALAFGLTILSFGLGLMVAMGLSMRIVHAATGAMC
jgi:nucleoside phosphorylase